MTTRLTDRDDVAARIDAHLRRLEAGTPRYAQTGQVMFSFASAWTHGRGSFLYVLYKPVERTYSLRLAQAKRYLAWLDLGGCGKHLDVPRNFRDRGHDHDAKASR
jgi:hypothetical protein